MENRNIYSKPCHQTGKEIDRSMEKDSETDSWKAKRQASSSQTAKQHTHTYSELISIPLSGKGEQRGYIQPTKPHYLWRVACLIFYAP